MIGTLISLKALYCHLVTTLVVVFKSKPFSRSYAERYVVDFAAKPLLPKPRLVYSLSRFLPLLRRALRVGHLHPGLRLQVPTPPVKASGTV